MVAVAPALVGDLDGPAPQQRGQHQPEHLPFPTVADAAKVTLQRAAGDLVTIGMLAGQVMGYLFGDGRLQIDDVFGAFPDHQLQAVGRSVKDPGQTVEVGCFQDLLRFIASEGSGTHVQLGVEVRHGKVEQRLQDLAQRLAQGCAVFGYAPEKAATGGQGSVPALFQSLLKTQGLGLFRRQA